MTRFSTNAAPTAKDSGFTLIPQGIYDATCEFVDLIQTKAGDMMFKMTYQITEDTGFLNRKIFDNVMWTFEPKDGSAEAAEKAAYTLEQAHGKLADALFAIDCDGFNSEEPGEVLDILLGRDLKIKIGQREDKLRNEKVNTADTFYTLSGQHRTRPNAPKKVVRSAPPTTRPTPPRQAPVPAIPNEVSPQDIINRQHKSQVAAEVLPAHRAPALRPTTPYRQNSPRDTREDTPF